MKRVIYSAQHLEGQETFSLSLTDKKQLLKIQWESENEFRFEGVMYDVITKKIDGSKLIIQCINDKNETALLNKLSENWKQNDGSGKIATQLFQLLQTLFHEDNSKDILQKQPANYFSLFLANKLPLQLKKILTPPPQISNC